MGKDKACPEPGIYYDVSFEEYVSWDAVNNSRLKLMTKSPLHYATGFKGEPTQSMSIGTFCHAGVLEPLSIVKRFVFEPDYSKDEENTTGDGARSFSSSTRYVKEQKAKFRELNKDKTIIDEQSYNKMIGVAGALSRCELMRFLMSRGNAEVSIVWIDDETGLRCKARADWVRASAPGEPKIVLDLKTTQDVSRFSKSIVDYSYHTQMAFYRRGFQAVLGHQPEMWICAIETSEPYGHQVAPMLETAIEIGDREVSNLLALVKKHTDDNYWPGYPHPEGWDLPSWKKHQECVDLVIGDEVLSIGG